MTKRDLETLLTQAGQLAKDHDFFLIGSQALRGVCPAIPRDFPKTIEADLYPRNHPEAWAVLRSKLGPTSQFYRENGFYLDCTDPCVAMLPDGWHARLIPFRTPRTHGVTAWCLDPHDLFITKLAAGREKDLLFLRAMLRHKLVKLETIRQRVNVSPIPASHQSELTRLAEDLAAKEKSKPRLNRKRN